MRHLRRKRRPRLGPSLEKVAAGRWSQLALALAVMCRPAAKKSVRCPVTSASGKGGLRFRSWRQGCARPRCVGLVAVAEVNFGYWSVAVTTIGSCLTAGGAGLAGMADGKPRVRLIHAAIESPRLPVDTFFCAQDPCSVSVMLRRVRCLISVAPKVRGMMTVGQSLRHTRAHASLRP